MQLIPPGSCWAEARQLLNLFLGLSLLFLTLSSLIVLLFQLLYQLLFVFLCSNNRADIYKEATAGFAEGNSRKVWHTSKAFSFTHTHTHDWPWGYCGIRPGFFQMNQEKEEQQRCKCWNAGIYYGTVSHTGWYEITTANANFHKSQVQISTLGLHLFCAKSLRRDVWKSYCLFLEI